MFQIKWELIIYFLEIKSLLCKLKFKLDLLLFHIFIKFLSISNVSINIKKMITSVFIKFVISGSEMC
jgi:hypothetical protein